MRQGVVIFLEDSEPRLAMQVREGQAWRMMAQEEIRQQTMANFYRDYLDWFRANV